MQNQVEISMSKPAEPGLVENDATPHQLVQMLIDGAVVCVETARSSMVKQNIAAKGEAISKAIDILTGLMESLNLEKGGEVAENLLSLYEYMQHKLLQANLYNRIDYLNEVLLLLKEIRQGWVSIPEDKRDAVAG